MLLKFIKETLSLALIAVVSTSSRLFFAFVSPGQRKMTQEPDKTTPPDLVLQLHLHVCFSHLQKQLSSTQDVFDLSLSVCLSVCLSVSLSLSVCLCLCVSLCLSLCLSLSLSLSVCLSVCLSLSLSLSLSVSARECVCVCACVCVSV